MNSEYTCDVVVVGGSLVGSSAAMFLAQQGLSVILLERRTTVSPHPRARGISVRTMELFRAAGIEDDIRQVGEDGFTFVVGENLAGSYQSVARPDTDTISLLSPTTPYSCDQNRVEPILRSRAEALGAQLWNGCTATIIELRATHVTVLVESASAPDQPRRPKLPGRITARYLIAADGANSRIREDLGIGRHGHAVPGTGISALFDANLEVALRGRRVSALVTPAQGALLFPKGKAREHNWFGLVPREDLDDVDPIGIDAIASAAIRSAVGDPNLDLTLLSVVTWRTGAFVADRYRSGRVFLVGDAAHLMPPYGGFGGNTGIADAHNLAWKIAAVCSGAAPTALLDTYEHERQPIAEFTVRHVMTRGFGLRSAPPNSPHSQLTPTQVSLGYCYPTDGVVDNQWLLLDPSEDLGTPGMRAPHVRLRGPVCSTLDLLDPRTFTFLVTEGSPIASALQSRPAHGVQTRAVRPEDVADAAKWFRVFREPSSGLLVRPDGIIGWRADGIPSDPSAAVASARARCLQVI